MSVVRHPTALDRELPLDHVAEQIRRERREQIRRAARDHQMAEQALLDARLAEANARKARDTAYQQLRELMKGCGRVVIADVMISVNQHGAVTVEPVQIL